MPICANLWSIKTYLWTEKPSLHIQHQSLEIFSLGMEDVDGMIGGLVELMQDAHVAVGKGGCSENGIAEIILCHYLRTGEGEEYASGTDFLESLHIQASVTL